MSKDMWVVYFGERIVVEMGWERNTSHLMDHYVVREVGKKPKRFKGETALSDVCRYAGDREFEAFSSVWERAMCDKSLQ